MLVEVKAKVSRIIEEKTRKRTETFLTDKEFFSQAEYQVQNLLSEEQSSHLNDGFEIQSLRISPIKEVCTQYQGEIPFIATLKSIWLEDDGTEKSLKYKVLLWADSLTQANNSVLELSSEGYDMEVESIKQVDYTYLTDDVNPEDID